MSLEKPCQEHRFKHVTCSGKDERLIEGRESLYLFLEVTDGVFISVGEKVQYAMFDVILLKMIHQMCAIALNTQAHAK